MGAYWNYQADKVKLSLNRRLFIVCNPQVCVTTYKVVTVLEARHNYEAKEERKKTSGMVDTMEPTFKEEVKRKPEEGEEHEKLNQKEKQANGDEEKIDSKKKKSKKKKHKDKKDRT